MANTSSSSHMQGEIHSFHSIKIVVVAHSLGHVQLFANPWTAGRQASLSFTPHALLVEMYIGLATVENIWKFFRNLKPEN